MKILFVKVRHKNKCFSVIPPLGLLYITYSLRYLKFVNFRIVVQYVIDECKFNEIIDEYKLIFLE